MYFLDGVNALAQHPGIPFLLFSFNLYESYDFDAAGSQYSVGYLGEKNG